MSRVPNDYPNWHGEALDHTANDNDGYMYLVLLCNDKHHIFNSTISSLQTGQLYEFSAYMANVIKNTAGFTKPNILFEVRSASNYTHIIAQYNTSDIPEYENLTWSKYGLSFNASTHSVILLMISNDPNCSGNDLAIDDIELRVCSTRNSDYNISKYIYHF